MTTNIDIQLARMKEIIFLLSQQSSYGKTAWLDEKKHQIARASAARHARASLRDKQSNEQLATDYVTGTSLRDCSQSSEKQWRLLVARWQKKRSCGCCFCLCVEPASIKSGLCYWKSENVTLLCVHTHRNKQQNLFIQRALVCVLIGAKFWRLRRARDSARVFRTKPSLQLCVESTVFGDLRTISVIFSWV